MDLNDAISAATTLSAVGDERINSIVDFFFPSISLDNSQQDALSMDYENQVSQSHTDGERGGAEWGGGGGGARQCPSQSVSNTQIWVRGGDGSEVATLPRSVIYRDTEVVTLCLYTIDLCN